MQTVPPRLWIIVGAALFAGLGIGFFAARTFAPDAQPPDGLASFHATDASRSADASTGSKSDQVTMAELLAGNKTPAERVALILLQPSGRFRERQIALLADSIPPKDIPAFLANLNWASGQDGRDVGEAMLRRWAEVDPQAANLYALKSDAINRRGALDATIGEWIAQDSGGAVAWARGLSPGADRDSAVTAVVRALSRCEPEAAFQMMVELDSTENQAFDVQEIMARWAAKDPQAAVAGLSKLKNPGVNGRAVINLARGWAQTDPAAAFGWLSQIEDVNNRRAAVPLIAGVWAQRDPDAALRAVESMAEGPDRQLALGAVAHGLAGTNLERAMGLVAQIPEGTARDLALGRIASTVAVNDPARAAGMIESLPQGFADAAIREIVPRLQSTEPAKAVDLALRLGDETSRGYTVASVLGYWLQSSPEGAAAWFQGKKFDSRTSWQISQTIASWAAQNPDAAANVLRTQAGGPNSGGALWDGVLPGIAKEQPRVAADLAASQKGNAVSGQTLREVGSQFAKTDPGASTTWLMRLPDNDARFLAAVGVAGGWASADPQASATWIEALPAGKLRDGAAAGYARQVASADPAAGLSWAATVSVEPLRDEIMSGTLSQWLRKDRAAAEAWIEQNPTLPKTVQDVVNRAKSASK